MQHAVRPARRRPGPADGAPPRRGAGRARRAGRSGSTCTCRSARCAAATATSTPTPPTELGPPAGAPRRLAGRRTPRPRSPRSGWPARVLGDVDVPVVDGLLRRRHADAAAARPTWARSLAAIDAEFGLAPGAEVTTEANPDSVDAGRPRRAARGRLHPDLVRHAVGGRRTCWPSSTAPTTRCGCPAVVGWARAAGFEQVSLDLIYGTPGESLADWETSLDAALACAPDHVSAYSLIVEEGTALARRVRRGELPMPDEDDLADKYAARRRAARRRPGSAGTRSRTGPATTRAPVPAQPRLLDRRRLVGRRPGRALPRRRRALVERQAPRGVRRPARARGSARRTPARCSTPRPAGSSGCCSRCGCATGCRSTVLDATGRAAVAGPGRRAGCSTADGDRLVLTRRGRLLADAVVRDLLP